MTPENAERELREWAAAIARRDDLFRAARRAGVSKHRIHTLTGVARTTIDRIPGIEDTMTGTYTLEVKIYDERGRVFDGAVDHTDPAPANVVDAITIPANEDSNEWERGADAALAASGYRRVTNWPDMPDEVFTIQIAKN